MGFSFWQLLIILVIAVLLFGSKRLRTLGSDLGDAIGGFRRSMGSHDEVAVTHERVSSTQEKQERA